MSEARAGLAPRADSSGSRDILIDARTMLAAVGKPGVALLDVRDVDDDQRRLLALRQGFCPRKGRIPGAVSLNDRRMMKPTADGPRLSRRTRSWPMRHRRHFTEYPGLPICLDLRASNTSSR